MNLKAVGYIRVSTVQQAGEEKVSLDIQETDIGSHCDSRGHTLTKIYRDIGYSGATKNRPEFKEMLRDARNGEFDVIVAWKSDRLSRGLFPAAALMEAIEGTSVTVEAVKDAIDLKTFGLLAAVGKIELESIRERCQMGAKGRANKGKVTGRIRYGYSQDKNGKPVVSEVQANIVRRIFELYQEGSSFDRVADKLNDDGIPAPAGKRWWSGTVASILKDEIYIGTKHWGIKRYHVHHDIAEDRDRRTIQPLPEENWVDVPYPPIIEQETFSQAQRLMKHHKRVHEGSLSQQVEFPLKGLIWCSEHGSPYGLSSYRDSNSGKLRRYYVCSKGTRYRKYQGKCSQPKINANKIDARIFKWLVEWLSNPEYLEDLKRDLRERLTTGNYDYLKDSREQLDKLEAERGRLINAYTKGYLPEAELDLHMRTMSERKEYYGLEVLRLESEFEGVEDTLKWMEAIPQGWNEDLTLFALMNDGELTPFFQRFLKQITITEQPSPDDVECIFRLGNLVTTTCLPC